MIFIEIIASLLGLTSVWLVTKQNMWCWPTGIVMVLLYVFIFYASRLYSDVILQLFFAIMQFYGWYYWYSGNKESTMLKITSLKLSKILFWSLAIVLMAFILGVIMKNYTNADLPYIDAATTSISVVAQWLMTKKILENWILWIIADVIYVVMYFYKGLYPTTILYFIFLGLAILGYQKWRENLKITLKHT